VICCQWILRFMVSSVYDVTARAAANDAILRIAARAGVLASRW
jgi:hypothetical protein